MLNYIIGKKVWLSVKSSMMFLMSTLMMTSSNGNIFRVTGHLCGEFTGPRWISRTKASDAELDVFFDLHPNKRLSKQRWGWWFETLSCPLWRHRNVFISLVMFHQAAYSACVVISNHIMYNIHISSKYHIEYRTHSGKPSFVSFITLRACDERK